MFTQKNSDGGKHDIKTVRSQTVILSKERFSQSQIIANTEC